MANRKSVATKSLATPLAPRSRNRKSVAARPLAAGSLYSVHPGVAMVQKWIAELPAKTGRTLGEWVTYIKKAGPKAEQDCREWLKAEYKLGTNTAWWLADKALGNQPGLADDSPEAYLRSAPIYVAQMYAGAKVHLRPIHDELVRLVRELGDDIRICPSKTIVPLYRRHVFAEIKPATPKRIDLGFALGEEPFTTRLLDTGGRAKKNRITHKVAIGSLDAIDLQVKRWLKQAYERDV